MTNTSPFEDSPTENAQEEEQPEYNLLTIPLSTYPGRIGARAFAYALIANGNREAGDRILDMVGREG